MGVAGFVCPFDIRLSLSLSCLFRMWIINPRFLLTVTKYHRCYCQSSGLERRRSFQDHLIGLEKSISNPSVNGQ
jgi:hypothetical protein